MAKSFYEPKKIVRYSDNIIKNEVGLGAAPTPALRTSATKVTPKTEAIPPSAAAVSAPAPAPTPAPVVVTTTPPPPVGETRAFSFDGATELTGSLPDTLTSLGYGSTIGLTLTPYWSSTEFGDFAICSYGKPDSDDTRLNVSLRRGQNIFGTTGTSTWILTEFITGSNYIRGLRLIPGANVHSGSRENIHLQIVVGDVGTLDQLVADGVKDTRSKKSVWNSADGVQQVQIASIKGLTPLEDYTLSIGGYNSGSDHYMSGSISNFYIVPRGPYTMSSPVSDSHYQDPKVKAAYKFEGNLDPAVGNVELYVNGTETYVSSSL